MANFKITATTTVAELKEQFHNEFGGILRVYQGRSEAPEDATLGSLGGKVGELECRASRTVGKFIEAFQSELGLKVKVYTKDNWVSVLDGITLATVREIPKNARKAQMEQYLAYQRDEKEEVTEEAKADTIQKSCEIVWNEEKVVSAYLYMPLSELADFAKTNCIEAKECTAEFFSYLEGKDLEIALKNTQGIFILPYNTNVLDKSQWNNVEKNGEGVCVAVELMYDGWDKASVFKTSLPPMISEYTSGKDNITVRPKFGCLQYDGILSSKNPPIPFIPFKITNAIKRNGETVDMQDSNISTENVEIDNPITEFSMSAEEGWKATEERVSKTPYMALGLHKYGDGFDDEKTIQFLSKSKVFILSNGKDFKYFSDSSFDDIRSWQIFHPDFKQMYYRSDIDCFDASTEVQEQFDENSDIVWYQIESYIENIISGKPIDDIRYPHTTMELVYNGQVIASFQL